MTKGLRPVSDDKVIAELINLRILHLPRRWHPWVREYISTTQNPELRAAALEIWKASPLVPYLNETSPKSVVLEYIEEMMGYYKEMGFLFGPDKNSVARFQDIGIHDWMYGQASNTIGVATLVHKKHTSASRRRWYMHLPVIFSGQRYDLLLKPEDFLRLARKTRNDPDDLYDLKETAELPGVVVPYRKKKAGKRVLKRRKMRTARYTRPGATTPKKRRKRS